MIALNLSGKINLYPHSSIAEKLNYFKSYFHFDKVYMHLWESDYIKYYEELKNLDVKYIISKEPEFSNQIINFVTRDNHPYQNKIINNLYQFYGIEKVFNYSLNEDCDYFIRCRFDNIFFRELNFDLFKDTESAAYVPVGGDWHSGVGDIFYVMNRLAAESMRSYFTDSISVADKVPFHAETLFRYHLINKNKINLYRFDYRVDFSKDKPYFADCNLPYLIIKDNLAAYQLFLFK